MKTPDRKDERRRSDLYLFVVPEMLHFREGFVAELTCVGVVIRQARRESSAVSRSVIWRQGAAPARICGRITSLRLCAEVALWKDNKHGMRHRIWFRTE